MSLSIELPCPACGRLLRAGACLRCAMAGALGALDEACADPEMAGTLSPETRAALPLGGFAAFAAPQLPGRFAHFAVRREIATGGMGTVYEAEDTRLARTVALKMIRAFAFSTAEEKARFTAEAGAAAALDHPHIVPIYEVGEEGGQPYFTMKLIEGGTLATRLEAGAMPAREVAELMAKVARAVHHAHQRGVLHRDLKPGNILLDAQGAPYLTDFGLAKLADRDSGLTLTHALLGTPQYMSPEQAAGHTREISTASDVWALGVMLYQMLSGRLPFTGESSTEIMRRVVEEEAVPLARKVISNQSVSNQSSAAARSPLITDRLITDSSPPDRDLSTIVARCLEKEPARRLPSAEFLAGELERWLRGEPIRSRQVATHERWWKWVRRHKTATAAIVVTSAALLVGTGVSMWQAARAKAAQKAAERNAAEASRQLAEADQATKVILDTLSAQRNYGSSPMIPRAELMRQIVARVQAFQGDPLRKARMLSQLGYSVASADVVPLRREALALAEPLLGADDQLLWHYRYELARAEVLEGSRPAEALQEMLRTLEWSRAHLGAEHVFTIQVGLSYARDLHEAGEHARAVERFAEVFRAIGLQPAAIPRRQQFFYRAYYARALDQVGRHAEAIAMGRGNVREALAEPKDSRSYDVARALSEHTLLLRDNQLSDEAVSTARLALDAFLNSAGPLDEYVVPAIDLLTSLLRQKGDTEALLALPRDMVREFDTRLGPAHEATAGRVKDYAQALLTAGQAPAADALCTQWLQRVRLPDGTLPASCEELRKWKAEAQQGR